MQQYITQNYVTIVVFAEGQSFRQLCSGLDGARIAPSNATAKQHQSKSQVAFCKNLEPTPKNKKNMPPTPSKTYPRKSLPGLSRSLCCSLFLRMN